MNVLVTGSNGQLGSEIKKLSSNYPYSFFFTDREKLDISNQKAIKCFIEKNSIDTIINCAAYTAVDRAEDEVALANEINHLAVSYLAQISKEQNIKLIH
ncbi:MAG TPA: NAD-dependent epimerase/dehydratase family protein, partial [Campylobacterales bacterium]|nr:NAD-dependent epimerase/dehydratase family protein [Campylobacterales bacterium]